MPLRDRPPASAPRTSALAVALLAGCDHEGMPSHTAARTLRRPGPRAACLVVLAFALVLADAASGADDPAASRRPDGAAAPASAAVAGHRAEVASAAAFPSASTAAAKPARTREPPAPFGLVVGRSTLEEAEAAWKEANARILSRGYGSIGPGLMDGDSKMWTDRIVLVDVADVPFEGTRPVRFAFVEGRLYVLQTFLRAMTKVPGTNAQTLTDDEVRALRQDIVARRGPPTRAQRDLFAGKAPNLFEWQLGSQVLSIHQGLGTVLAFVDPALLKRAKQVEDDACRQDPQCARFMHGRR